MQGDLLHTVELEQFSPRRQLLGKALIRGSAALLLGLFSIQAAHDNGWLALGFDNWRPILFAYVLWAVCLCVGQVLLRGEQGKRALFVLAANLLAFLAVCCPPPCS